MAGRPASHSTTVPCTAKDVQELNARLLRDFVDECVARLHDELRLQLDKVVCPHQVDGREPYGESLSSKSASHCGRQGPPCDTKAATPPVDPGWHNLGQVQPRGMHETWEEWSGDTWADADETQWLLSKPFGARDMPSNDHNMDCNELQLLVLEKDDIPDKLSKLAFVKSDWYRVLSACVIMLNALMVIMEETWPTMRSLLHWPEQIMLMFFVLEIVIRIKHSGKKYFRGLNAIFVWKVFECVVVIAGVLREWVFALIPQLVEGNLCRIVEVLWFLRILRIFRVLRLFIESDLSWVEEPGFQSFIGVVITFNSVLMGFETDVDWSGFLYIEQALLVIYVFELSVRLRISALNFFACDNPDFNWNVIDLVIVSSSVTDSWVCPFFVTIADRLNGADSLKDNGSSEEGATPINVGQFMMLMRMLRLMRILRLARLVKAIKPLYIIVASITAAFQGVIWVLMFTVVVLYAMGLLATRLIGHRMIFADEKYLDDSAIQPFKTVFASMFTLFRLMSGSSSEVETHAIENVMAVVPWFKFCFVFFMITSSWTLLSILTAVVSDVMITTSAEQQFELKLAADEEDRAMRKTELEALFEKIDIDHDGKIGMHELNAYLRLQDNAIYAARICRVAKRDLVHVFQTLDDEGEAITSQHFVNCMTSVGEPVTQKSIMILESQIRDLHRSLQGDSRAAARFTQMTFNKRGSITLPSNVLR